MSRRDRGREQPGEDARQSGPPPSGRELFGGQHAFGGQQPHDHRYGDHGYDSRGYDGRGWDGGAQRGPDGWDDPAYAAQVRHPSDPGHDPTRVLPTGHRDEVSPVSGSPRWLWALAGLAVVFVVGLAVALVIVTSNSQQETMVAPALSPASAMPTTTRARPVVPPATTSSRPTTTPSSADPSSTPQTTPPPAGATETVTYQVDGTGRAISITYSDADSMLQTEFNVALPWTRTVSLPAPASSSASVTIFNVSNQVTCTVTVDGAQVRRLTGVGLTSCNPLT